MRHAQPRAPAGIVPVILAAGPRGALPEPQALARFGRRTALAIAVANARALAPPVVVLGCEAARVRKALPAGTRFVVNRRWRAGQLASLRAGLRCVPAAAAFLLYPVDYPLVTSALLLRLARGFRGRAPGEAIVVPRYRGRGGHPVIFAAAMRAELRAARSLRDLVYRDPRRVRAVAARTAAIWADFDTPAALRRRQRQFGAG